MQTSHVAVFKISVCFVYKNSVRTICSLNYVPRPWIRQPLIKLRFLPQLKKDVHCVMILGFTKKCFTSSVCLGYSKYHHHWEKLSCFWRIFFGIACHWAQELWEHSDQAAKCTVVVLIWGKWPDTVDPAQWFSEDHKYRLLIYKSESHLLKMVFKITEAMLMESVENLWNTSNVKWAVCMIWEAWLEGACHSYYSSLREKHLIGNRCFVIEANACF